MFSTDRLSCVNRGKTAKVVYRLMDRLQTFPKEEQVAAVAVLFCLMARVLGVRPDYLHDIALKITKIDEEFPTEGDRTFLALQDYIQGEIA